MNFNFSCQDKTLRKCEPSFSANSLGNLVLALKYTFTHPNVIFVLCKNPLLLTSKKTLPVDVVELQKASVNLAAAFSASVIFYLPFPFHDLCLCLSIALAMLFYRGE